MDREWLLTMLIVIAAGVSFQAWGAWPAPHSDLTSGQRLERHRWIRVWRPVVPALLLAAWLCGWALIEPDPVPERVPWLLAAASAVFVPLFLRAMFRAVKSLIASRDGHAIGTVGLLWPSIRVSAALTDALDQRAFAAAVEHERAHARHRDPLRIWLAQFVTDLQWPWPHARERFSEWLAALELARDEEARRSGVDGSDLAEAILASIRLSNQASIRSDAGLTGDLSFLKERIGRLLRALEDPTEPGPAARIVTPLLGSIFAIALALGSLFGESVMRVLLSSV